ncbi:MAG: hypothetical protein JXR51_07655 [Bacteroidales bacterium]|nr:hypothetical protein [Bacteroidales bacterium]MBN2757034.1 hypothetical protein [Bacteroidales bacterium]
MKKYIIISAIFVASLIPTNSFTQSFIVGSNNSTKLDKTFQKSSKSRELKLKKGSSYKIDLKLKNGRLYYISVCGNKAFKNIQYQLKTETEKTEILYDNAAHEFDKYNTFRVKNDTTITLEIITQPALCFECNTIKRDVNVLIAYKKINHYEDRKNIPDLLALASNN